MLPDERQREGAIRLRWRFHHHLLALAQIAQFTQKVRQIYPPGLKMFLVIVFERRL